MTRQANRGRLVTLLQQLRTMQSGFGDEGIEIIHVKHFSACQSADDERNGLELRARLRDTVFVHTECLHVEVICEVFETTFISNLGGQEEQSESDIGRIDGGGEN